jgi:hypothetical protein
MYCSANQQITDNSFGWRIEESAREQQRPPVMISPLILTPLEGRLAEVDNV